jgi:hypothetical protein
MSASSLNQIPSWSLKADYVETCNCDYGCPCNFNGFPSNGFCSALVLYHIRSGNYGNVNLGGIDVVTAFSWPNAIHEGNGTVQFFITKNSSDEQEMRLYQSFRVRPKGMAPLHCLPVQ